jgi:hypothetical protein
MRLMATGVGLPPAGKKEPPTPLAGAEKFLAGLLIVAGIGLIIAVPAIFLTDGKWLIEETTTTGEGATKTVATKKYSDTLPLTAVGVGGLLVLCGAFFGRLREITLPGGAGIKLADAKEKLDEKVEEKAKRKAEQGEVPEGKVEDLKEAALKEASASLLDRVSTTAAPPPDRELDRMAEQAVESAKEAL